ncbi:ABC transporter substrate-binding protein [Paenibacillus sp. N4]|uniref:ABC transporter substrate-binding protein n=1 Tax=Paenibacillus vietnamensis TaxID=2590547 RepID=UPI001CD18CE9|nr:ABC transporter substrate-binding protein [Paenibacillus vietnamensis]MCA0755919.1 ABC transporter substrate-binding protein [Paenibacillus vietnamensis]
MNRKALTMTVLLLAIALVTGCGGNGPGNEQNGETTGKQNITLTYLASQGWIYNAEMELAKKFEEQTGIKIDYQIIPADQYFNVLKTKLNAKEGPDIFGGQSGKSEISLNYNVKENAVDLSDQEWTKRIDPLSLETATLDGKVYAQTIWDTGNSFVMVYNKKIFAELGLTVPKTYEELKQASLKIKESGVTPIYEPIADGWHHVMWLAEPGPRYDELTPGLYDDLNANKKKFADDPSMLNALTQLKEIYDLGFFGDNTFSDTGAGTTNKLASGEFAMALSAQSIVGDVVKANPEMKEEDFGYFVLPIADNQFYYINPGGPSKFVYSQGKHLEAAKQYLDFLAQPENLQYLLDNTKEFTNLNFTGLTDKYTDAQKDMFAAYPKKGTDIQNVVSYVNAQWMDIGKDISAMLANSMEPADILKNIDKRRAEMAKVAKDPAWSE